MAQLIDTQVFNQKDRFIEGWYWLLKSSDLRKGKVKSVQALGEEVVLFRGRDNKVRALQAYCPHMGAHLKLGKVEGNQLRCLFHYWRFNGKGNCTDVPCESIARRVKPLKTYIVTEHYGLIWIWSGNEVTQRLPEVPELEGQEVEVMMGRPFHKLCHPNVMMINAIDEQHFYSVHPMVRKLAGDLRLESRQRNINCLELNNVTPVPKTPWINRLLGPFYAGAFFYRLSYWFGSTGTVSVGPDKLHFHIVFATRPTPEGETLGHVLTVTRKRKGLLGKIINKLLLLASRIVANYFARGDTLIFSSIKFRFQTPVRRDRAIIDFIQHAEKQTVAHWGFSKPQLTDHDLAPIDSKGELLCAPQN